MAAATTTTLVSVKPSWADIVKGRAGQPTSPVSVVSEQANLEEAQGSALQPSARGERRCLCQGEVLVMLGHYGWIMSFGEIDHPDVGKTGGRIYVHKRDVANGTLLTQGDVVSFYLYADDQGLGAESCKLEQRTSACLDAEVDPAELKIRQRELKELRIRKRELKELRIRQRELKDSELAELRIAQRELNPYWTGGSPSGILPRKGLMDDDEDVSSHVCAPPTWNVCAHEFVPTAGTTTPMSFNAQAAEFVPSTFGAYNADAKEFVPSSCFSNAAAASNPNVLAINFDLFSDDESDDDESSMISSDGLSGIEGDKEGNDSDNESLRGTSQHAEEITCCPRFDAVVLRAPLKPLDSLSDGDSTSAGAPSDSDTTEVMSPAKVATMAPPPWRRHGGLPTMAPPGLSMTPGFGAPPGLSLPVAAA